MKVFTWTLICLPRHYLTYFNLSSQTLLNRFQPNVPFKSPHGESKSYTDQKPLKVFCEIFWWTLPARIYLFKVHNEDTRNMCKICSWVDNNDNKLLTNFVKHSILVCRSAVIIVNFKQISRFVLLFQLLTLNK